MIRINLLAEKEDKSSLYFIQLLAFAGVLLITLFSVFIFHDSEVTRLANLESRKQTLTLQLGQLKKQTREVENLEEKQKTLKEKLTTISLLKSRKRGPVHVLHGINLSIPERSWLESIEQTGDRKLLINGVALDDRTVASFVENLEKSEYFSQIEILETTQTSIDDVKLRKFGLSASVTSFVVPEAQESEKNKEKSEK